MKRFFSGLLILSLCFPPFATAQEVKLPPSPQDIKLQKTTEEANRNRELLEIWKDHVRTVTKERDEAYQQIETLKAVTKSPAIVPAGSATAAHFGEIETLSLPPSAAMKGAVPAPLPASASSPTDFQGYQDTIRELRRQLEETRAGNQRMQKQMMEAGNDKTLIIRDKEQAIAKIDSMNQQVRVLQNENERLRASGAALSPGAAQAIVSSYAPDNTVGSNSFLQNAYNTQSEKLKQVIREKDQVAQRADELQAKYVDLQSAYEQLKVGRSQNPALSVSSPVSSKQTPSVSAADPNKDFEINHLKSQNAKLKTEFEKIRMQSEKISLDQQSVLEESRRLRTQNEILTSQRTSLNASQEAAALNFESLKRENNELRAQTAQLKTALDTAQKNSQSLSSVSTAMAASQAENSALKNSLQQLQAYQSGNKVSQDSVAKNLETLKNENNELRAQTANLKAVLSTSQKNAQATAAVSASLAALRSENDSLRKSMEQLQTANSRLNQSVRENDLKTAVAPSLSAENIKLKSQLDSIASDNKLLKTRLGQESSEAQSSQQELKKALEASQLNSVSLKSENDKLTAVFRELKAENQALKVQASKKPESDMENKYLQRLYSDLVYKMKRREVALDHALKQVYMLKMDNRRTSATAQELYKSVRLALKTEGEANQSKTRLIESEKIEMQKQITELRTSLQAANELNQKMKGKNADLVAQVDRLNVSLANIQSDKEEAATLRAQKETIQNQVSEIRADLETANELNRKIKEKNVFLAAQVESNGVNLKELQAEKETAGSLRVENQRLISECEKLKVEKENAQSRAENLNTSLKYAQAEKEKSVALESEKTRLSYENDDLKKQLQSAMTNLRSMQSEKEAAAALRVDKQKLAGENETMKKAMIDVEREAQANEDKITGLRDRNSYLEQNQQEQQKTIDELKASLKKSLDDIQNLKSNFQSYLESMVSSFEERQKKSPAVESSAP